MNHNLKQKFYQLVQEFLGQFGLALVRGGRAINRNSMRGAIQSLAKRGTIIDTIVDIGASDGQWTSLAMEFFPKATYLLIEAQPIHQEKLNKFIQAHSNIQYCLAAAGDKEGNIFFDASDPFGGQASYEPYPKNNIEVPVTTIDSQIALRGLTGPYLLKFDVHGFELPIFSGATSTLQNTAVIVIECYVQTLMKDSFTFSQMCAYLDELGFRCIDAVDFLWRPYDSTLWQMDLVFIRKDRPEFTYYHYT
jgi:FkbM family methyltransferase